MRLLSGKELFFLWCHGTRDHERGAAHGFNSMASLALMLKLVPEPELDSKPPCKLDCLGVERSIRRLIHLLN